MKERLANQGFGGVEAQECGLGFPAGLPSAVQPGHAGYAATDSQDEGQTKTGAFHNPHSLSSDLGRQSCVCPGKMPRPHSRCLPLQSHNYAVTRPPALRSRNREAQECGLGILPGHTGYAATDSQDNKKTLQGRTRLAPTIFALLACLFAFSLPAQTIDSQIHWQDGKAVLKSRFAGEPSAEVTATLAEQAAMLAKLTQAEAAIQEKREPDAQKAFLLDSCKLVQSAAGLLYDRDVESAARELTKRQDNQGHVHGNLRKAINGFTRSSGIGMRVLLEEERPDKVGETSYHEIWNGALSLTGTAFTELALDRINDETKRYRIVVTQGDYKEILYPSRTKTGVYVYGAAFAGVFPDNNAWVTIGVHPVAKQDKAIPVEINVRDGDETIVYTGQAEVNAGTDAIAFYRFPVTPQDGAIGPFEVEVTIDHDALSFDATVKLSLANSLLPLSSLEDPHPALWFVGPGDPTRMRTSSTLDGQHISQLMPVDYPRLEWDAEVKRSGQQALKLGYDFKQHAVAWSRLALPGKATHLSVWVKGNNSQDDLYIHYVDKINYTVPNWARAPNTGSEFICKLNFADWRKFRVPVFADGVITDSILGSTKHIDGPISIMCFRVDARTVPEGKEAGNPTAVWIDDITVESQTTPAEQLSMELVQNEDTLTANSSVKISLGNGTGKDLSKGQIGIQVKEEGKTVYTQKIDAPAAKNAFVVTDVGLQELAAMKLRGPVSVSFTYSDVTVPGAKISRQAVFKRATQGGIFQDFERVDAFNSLNIKDKKVGPPLSTLVAKGAGKALLIEVKGDRPFNNALIHPSLPGIPDSVTMNVKGTGKPLTLELQFIDNTLPGVQEMPYNVFWTKAIQVDWEGWKDVTIAAPTIPADYRNKNLYFYRKPWYPLNLVIGGSVAEEGDAAQLMIDDIRVSTHVQASDELTLAIDHADSTQLHEPGTPLVLRMANMGQARKAEGTFELRHLQGFVAAKGALQFELRVGQLLRQTIVPTLEAGIYELSVTGITEEPMTTLIQVVDRQGYFGGDVVATSSDPIAIRRQLSLMQEDILLDWDNSEAAPYLFHYNWFRKEVEKNSMGGALTMRPVLGYSADWSGLEARDSVANNSYERTYPNSIQRPARLIDWSLFVREMVREYKAEYAEWVFWENPDLDQSPQSIPPDKYADMLKAFHRWVKLYNPKAKVVAGGFNFDHALPYLDKIIMDPETGETHPEKLMFDAISVQISIGELAPERADLEGFLDELNQTLHNADSTKEIQMAELDWGIGEHLSPLQQAAYHTRAQLILNSRGARRHTFKLMNGGNAFLGHGVFWKQHYGSNDELQTFRPNMIPKPAYFSLVQTQSFLKDWRFVKSVKVSDLSLDHNRAYVYRNAAGELSLAYWRAVAGEQHYAVPASWQGADFRDAFSFKLHDTSQLTMSELPTFVFLPKRYSLDQLIHDLRSLETSDKAFPVIADIHPSEPDSAKRAGYTAAGELRTRRVSGTIPGGERITETFTYGIRNERFQFELPEAGNALLRRVWDMSEGQVVSVALNKGDPMQWDLRRGDGEFSGIRQSTLVLKDCKAGKNTIALSFAQPSNTCSYRITPLTEGFVHLDQMGIIKTQQAQGDLLLHQSVSSTPLTMNKTKYGRGIGMHAKGFIEYPLNGQFTRLQLTIGIDAVTEGRGTVKALFIADGKLIKTSKIINGFSKPLAVTIDNLDKVNRLLIVADDAGDGEKMDYVDLVDGKLYYAGGTTNEQE